MFILPSWAFHKINFKIKTVVTKEFFNNVKDLIYGGYVIHHSHVTGEIIGYLHDLCNKKIRENNNLIPVFAHNLFSFDFFFVVKKEKVKFAQINDKRYYFSGGVVSLPFSHPFLFEIVKFKREKKNKKLKHFYNKKTINFPSTMQLGNILKFLTNSFDRETINYITARDLWINRLYMYLSNE